MSDNIMLTLDIGTRKVVGLLTKTGPKGLRILAAERLEHSTRAMYDGQIHDVVAVAAIVGRIVAKLAAKAGTPLTEAAVAAAGRALRTFKGTAVRELTGLTEVTHDEVFAMELEGVQDAQLAMASALSDREHPHDYHYVGHSVMGARLDSLSIGNLVGQRGHRAELDVIATFLPRGVVDSLQSVLQRNGLEMTALTLEPIAALSVAVPQSMRHLNLVLVDIGAGTSDIAITNKGTVIAYDMVPIAGDEITEALSECYLLDFPGGEAVKQQSTTNPEVSFTDILGQKHTASNSEIAEALLPAVERLAQSIAERILKLNGGPPQAIMLVGGGSLTPGLPAALATAVGLSPTRVAIRGRDAITGVEGAKKLLSGPDAVTPIGIAVAARERSTLGFHLIYVDGQAIRLFNPSHLTVGDALLAASIRIRDLQGTIGKGLTVSVNGSLRIVRGTIGRPAVIYRGTDEIVTLETPIQHRDHLSITPAVPGLPGNATVTELMPSAAVDLPVSFNGIKHLLSPRITVNDQIVPPDHQLEDNDVVTIRSVETVGEALISLGCPDPDASDRIRFTLDGAPQSITRPRYTITVNGQLTAPEEALHPNDQLTITPFVDLTIQEVAAATMEKVGGVRVTLNGRRHLVGAGRSEVSRNGRPAGPDDVIAENDVISVQPKGEAPIFAQLLAEAGVNVTPPTGKTHITMLLNGKPVEFTTPLRDGDRAELNWE